MIWLSIKGGCRACACPVESPKGPKDLLLIVIMFWADACENIPVAKRIKRVDRSNLALVGGL